MSSLIVEVVEVSDVQPHPDADRLDIATVKGWSVVTQRGAYKPGDHAVYFPPDSVLTPELAEKFGITQYAAVLPKNPDGTRPPGYRIKAARIRGEQSFGFLAETEDPEWTVGTSLIDHYGVTKFDPPDPVESFGGAPQGDTAKDIPEFHLYTDIENLKNFPDAFEEGETVVITEKIHGMNARIGYLPGNEPEKYVVGSRTRRKKDPSEGARSSVFWNAATEQVRAMLKDISEFFDDANVILFGEIYGAKVQDMTYGLSTQEFRAFDISVNGKYLPYTSFNSWTLVHKVPTVPILYHGAYSSDVVKQLVDGQTTLCNPDKNGKFKGREGIVIKPITETYKSERHRQGRKIYKVISIDYLTRRGGTEYH